MTSVTTTFYLKSDNVEDFNKKVNELLNKDPLMPIPAYYIGKMEKLKDDVFTKVEDRLNIKMKDLIPNEEDIEVMAVAVMGTVPVIGPIMQGVFTLMSNKVKGNQREEEVTKETVKNMVNIEIAKVKNELVDTIKKKVEKSSIDQKVKLCEKGFEGIKESHLESLFESLTHLKLRLLKKEIPDKNDSLLVGIRSHFDSLRKSLKTMLSFSNDQVIIQNAPNLSVQIIGMYILTLNNLIYHWFQYGFDPEYARGTPADDEEPATHSYREKLHINIQNFLKQVQIATNTYSSLALEIKRSYDEGYDITEEEEVLKKRKKTEDELKSLHVCDINNVDKVFEADPFYYPIPLIKEYEFTKSDGRPRSFNKIKIQTSKKKGPCIYRIDGQDFCNLMPTQQQIKSHTSDLATKCYGQYFMNSPSCVDIEFDEPKDIRIRCLFGHHKDITPEMTCVVDNVSKQVKGDYEVYPSISGGDQIYFGNNSKFGFFTTESYGKKKKISLQVLLEVYVSKLTFCEIIVTD